MTDIGRAILAGLNRFSLRLAVPLAITSMATGPVLADDGTWTGSTGNWSDTAKWTGGTVAGGAGSVATIDRTGLTGALTITVNSPSIVLGELHATSVPSGTPAGLNVIVGATSGTNPLTFNNGGAAAQISNAGLSNFVVRAPILLEGDLQLANNPSASAYLRIDGQVSSSTAGLKTITTMPVAVPNASGEFHRIIINTTASIVDGVGKVALVHNSGSNLNILTNSNTFSGGLAIDSGAVRVGGAGVGDGALGAANGAVSFAGGALEFYQAGQTIVSSSRPTTINAGGATLGVTAADTTVTWNGTITGAGVLAKSGAGTLVLAGADNAHAGGTVITAGTLIAKNDSALGTGSVSITGGILSLDAGVSVGNRIVIADTGTLRSTNGVATVTGRVEGVGHLGAAGTGLSFADTSVLTVGRGSGAMTLDGAVNLLSGAIYQWELAAPVSDATGVGGTDFAQLVISGTGNLVIESGVSLELAFGAGLSPLEGNGFWTMDQTWTIISSQAGGALSGALLAVDNTSWAGFGSFSTALVGGDMVLTWSVIPEPSTYVAILGGLTLVGAAWWRRRRAV